MQKIISTADARKRFAEITDAVAFQGDEYIILKNGKEVAKLVPANTETAVSPDLKAWIEDFSDSFTEDLQTLAAQ